MDSSKAFLRSLLFVLPVLGLTGCESDDNNTAGPVTPGGSVPQDPGASQEETDKGEDNLTALTAESFEQALADFERAVQLDETNDKAKFLLAITSFVDFVNNVRTSESGGGPASPLGTILEKGDIQASSLFPGQSAFSGPLPPTIVKAFELLEGDPSLLQDLENGVILADSLFSAPALLPADSATGADYQAWVRALRDKSRRAAQLLESIDPAFDAVLVVPLDTLTDPASGATLEVTRDVPLAFSDALVLAMHFRALEISAGFGIAFDLDMDIDELSNWKENGLAAPYRLFNGSSPQFIAQGERVFQDLGAGLVERRGFLNESGLTRSQNTFLPAADADATFLAIRLAMTAFVEDFQSLIALQVSDLQEEFINGPPNEFNPFATDIDAEKDCLNAAFGPWLADVRAALVGQDAFIAPHVFTDLTCGLDVAFAPLTFRASGLLSAATYDDRVFLPELDSGQLFADATDFSTAVNSADLGALALETAGVSIDGQGMLELWEALEGAWESHFLDAGQVPGGGGDPDPDPDPACGSNPPPVIQVCDPSTNFGVNWTTSGSPNGTNFSVDGLTQSEAAFALYDDQFDAGLLFISAFQIGLTSDVDELFFLLDGVTGPGVYFAPLDSAGYFFADLQGQSNNFTNADSFSTSFQVTVDTLTDQCISGSFSGTLLSTIDGELLDVSGSFDFRVCTGQ